MWNETKKFNDFKIFNNVKEKKEDENEAHTQKKKKREFNIVFVTYTRRAQSQKKKSDICIFSVLYLRKIYIEFV